MTPVVDDEIGLRTQRLPDGRLDTQVRTAAGTWVRVHSLHTPEAEAKALLDNALDGRSVPSVVAVLGVGLGYVIDEIERRRPDAHIVALELAPAFVDEWSRRRDWDELIQRGRLIVGVAPGFDLPIPTWPASVVDEAPLVVVHPAIGLHLSEVLEQARKAFRQFLFEQRANADARRRLAAPYLLQTIENLPVLASSSDLRALDGLALGHTAVLCGAGPSLDDLLPSLRTYRDRAWLIALDTALRPLMLAGIVPDLVVSVDPTALNGRHLLNLPARSRPWLVAEASLDPRVYAAFAGRIFACRLGAADPWPWLDSAGFSVSRLNVWGSVLTAACDLVSKLQAPRVVFAGMELAFTNDQPYCRGTAFEEDWRAQQHRDKLPSIEAVWRKRISEHNTREPDADGVAVKTSPQMVAFRNWVRTFVASNPTVEFINATGAGILHGPGIRQAGLAEALGALPKTWAPENALRAAARPAFADGASRLRSALDAVTASDRAAASSPIREWMEVVPDLDDAGLRQRLQHVARRLRAQEETPTMHTHQETTTTADWVDVPYDASNFSAKAPLEWEVGESSVATYAYRVDRKTMTLAFKINHGVLTGRPANELYLRIPGNYLPARGMANTVWLCSQVGKECGYATVHEGHDSVVLFRGTEEPFPAACDFFVFGQLTFEVQ